MVAVAETANSQGKGKQAGRQFGFCFTENFRRPLRQTQNHP